MTPSHPHPPAQPCVPISSGGGLNPSAPWGALTPAPHPTVSPGDMGAGPIPGCMGPEQPPRDSQLPWAPWTSCTLLLRPGRFPTSSADAGLSAVGLPLTKGRGALLGSPLPCQGRGLVLAPRDCLERAVRLRLVTSRRDHARAWTRTRCSGPRRWALPGCCGHRWPSLDAVTEPDPACLDLSPHLGTDGAAATGTLGWSPLPFPGLPCVSLRYGGMGSRLVRRCPALPHGTRPPEPPAPAAP